MKLKILHITPEAPGYNSGGKLGIYQTTMSITNEFTVVDYVGPEISDEDIKKRYRSIYELEPNENQFIRIIDSMKGNTNKRYRSWKKLNIKFSIYDYIMIDFTKLDYVVKDLISMGISQEKLYIRVHNIEADYSRSDFKTNKSLMKLLTYLLSKKREKYIAKNIKKFIFLTNNDLNRFKELYYMDKKQAYIIPVCVNAYKHNNKLYCNKGSKVKMLLTGSLWFGPNVDGAMWLLDNVISKLTIDYELTIAGYRPNNKLKEKIADFTNVKLIDSPETMDTYYSEADLILCPVFEGAGMKVKVAEGLSYGKVIVGTSHAFIGYKIIDKCNGLIADTTNEFKKQIEFYAKMNTSKREEFSKRVIVLFEKKYSLSVSGDMFMRCFDQGKEE